MAFPASRRHFIKTASAGPAMGFTSTCYAKFAGTNAVMIASPDHLQLEAAIKAKKDAYVEKPLAMVTGKQQFFDSQTREG